jgi:hypothetical protein
MTVVLFDTINNAVCITVFICAVCWYWVIVEGIGSSSSSIGVVLRPSQNFFTLYGDITVTSEGLQNLGLCSALRAFEQGGIFIVPHLL